MRKRFDSSVAIVRAIQIVTAVALVGASLLGSPSSRTQAQGSIGTFGFATVTPPSGGASPAKPPNPSPSSASVTISPTSGPPGTAVTVRAIGFKAQAEIVFVWGPIAAGSMIFGDWTTDSSGASTQIVVIPSDAQVGDHALTVSDAAKTVRAATFTVIPLAAPSQPTANGTTSSCPVNDPNYGCVPATGGGQPGGGMSTTGTCPDADAVIVVGCSQGKPNQGCVLAATPICGSNATQPNPPTSTSGAGPLQNVRVTGDTQQVCIYWDGGGDANYIQIYTGDGAPIGRNAPTDSPKCLPAGVATCFMLSAVYNTGETAKSAPVCIGQTPSSPTSQGACPAPSAGQPGTMTVTLSPTCGPIGTTVTATGSNWKPGDHISTGFDAVKAETNVDNQGNFALTFTVPATAAVGPRTLTFTSAPLACETVCIGTFWPATFTVTPGSVSPGAVPDPDTSQLTASVAITPRLLVPGSTPKYGGDPRPEYIGDAILKVAVTDNGNPVPHAQVFRNDGTGRQLIGYTDTAGFLNLNPDAGVLYAAYDAVGAGQPQMGTFQPTFEVSPDSLKITGKVTYGYTASSMGQMNDYVLTPVTADSLRTIVAARNALLPTLDAAGVGDAISDATGVELSLGLDLFLKIAAFTDSWQNFAPQAGDIVRQQVVRYTTADAGQSAVYRHSLTILRGTDVVYSGSIWGTDPKYISKYIDLAQLLVMVIVQGG